MIEVKRAILSVRMLLAQGYQVTFTEEASFIARGELRLPLERRKGLFVLKARARANICATEKLGALQADRVAQLGKRCHQHGDKDQLRELRFSARVLERHTLWRRRRVHRVALVRKKRFRELQRQVRAIAWRRAMWRHSTTPKTRTSLCVG